MVWFFMTVALILMATAVYSIHNRQKLVEEFTEEMKGLIQEAEVVKKDFEAVMDNAVLLSDEILKSMDERLQKMERLVTMQNNSQPAKSRVRSIERPSRKALPFTIEELRRAHPSIVVPRLWNEGYTIPEIAEILNRGQGEVRLILNLQKRREISS